MESKEFNVGEFTYRAVKLDVFKQWHVARRLAPLFKGISGSLNSVKENPLEAIGPFCDALAGLSDTDSDYIMKSCLRVVQRKQDHGTGWANVSTADGQLMFKDIQLPQLLEIMYHVIDLNLFGFLAVLPSDLTEQAQTSKSS